MTDGDVDSLARLLDECRAELAAAVDDLDRSRAAHRAVESLLLGVLDHVPIPLVVVDGDGRIRAATAAAEAAWGAQVGDLAAGAPAEASRLALDTNARLAGPAPEGVGVGAGVLDEPGTGVRYAVVWAAAEPSQPAAANSSAVTGQPPGRGSTP